MAFPLRQDHLMDRPQATGWHGGAASLGSVGALVTNPTSNVKTWLQLEDGLLFYPHWGPFTTVSKHGK